MTSTSRNCLVLLSLLGCFSLLSCSGGGFPIPGGGGFVAVSAPIGPMGGQVVSGDGLLVLDIPAGALMTNELITITRLTSAELDPQLAVANPELAYRMEPDGLQFLMPVTATFDMGPPDLNTAGMVTTGLMVALTASQGVAEALDDIELVVDATANTTRLSGSFSHFSQLVGVRSEVDDDIEYTVSYPPSLVGGMIGTVTGMVRQPADSIITGGPIRWVASTSPEIMSSIETEEIFDASGLFITTAQTLTKNSTLSCTALGTGRLAVTFNSNLDSILNFYQITAAKIRISGMEVECTGGGGIGNLPYTSPQLFSIPQLSNIEGIQLSKDALPCANPFSAVVAGQGGAAQIDLATGTVTDIFSTGGGGLTFDALTFPPINPGDDAGILLSGQGIEMKRIDANCNPGPFSQVNTGIHLDATYNGTFSFDGAHIAGPGVIKRVVHQPLSQGWEFQDTGIPVSEIPSGLQSVKANAAGDKILAVGQFELVLIDGSGPGATSTSAFSLGSNPRRVRWDETSGFGAISDFTDDTVTVFSWDGQGMPVMTDIVNVGDGPVGIDVQGNRIASVGFNDDSYTIITLDANGQATLVTTNPSPFTTGGSAPGHIIFLGDPNDTVIISFNGDGTIGVIPNAF